MWASEAYPKGEASEEVTATKMRGERIERVGKTAGVGSDLGVE